MRHRRRLYDSTLEMNNGILKQPLKISKSGWLGMTWRHPWNSTLQVNYNCTESGFAFSSISRVVSKYILAFSAVPHASRLTSRGRWVPVCNKSSPGRNWRWYQWYSFLKSQEPSVLCIFSAREVCSINRMKVLMTNDFVVGNLYARSMATYLLSSSFTPGLTDGGRPIVGFVIVTCGEDSRLFMARQTVRLEGITFFPKITWAAFLPKENRGVYLKRSGVDRVLGRTSVPRRLSASEVKSSVSKGKARCLKGWSSVNPRYLFRTPHGEASTFKYDA